MCAMCAMVASLHASSHCTEQCVSRAGLDSQRCRNRSFEGSMEIATCRFWHTLFTCLCCLCCLCVSVCLRCLCLSMFMCLGMLCVYVVYVCYVFIFLCMSLRLWMYFVSGAALAHLAASCLCCLRISVNNHVLYVAVISCVLYVQAVLARLRTCLCRVCM